MHPKGALPTWREVAEGLVDIGYKAMAADIMEVYQTGQST